MRFVLDIETDNAAFEGENIGFETAQILEKVAATLESGFIDFPHIKDSNGNHIGMAGFFAGGSYSELKGALLDLLSDYEEGMECDAPDSVIQARKLLRGV